MNTLIDKLHRLFGRPLSCEDVNRFLEAYLDDALEARVRTTFEAHLAACPNCRAYFDQYRTTIALVKEDAVPPPPPELVASTLAFLRRHYNEGLNGPDIPEME